MPSDEELNLFINFLEERYSYFEVFISVEVILHFMKTLMQNILCIEQNNYISVTFFDEK